MTLGTFKLTINISHHRYYESIVLEFRGKGSDYRGIIKKKTMIVDIIVTGNK